MVAAMNDTDAIRRLMLAVERLERAAGQQAGQAQESAEGLQQLHAAQARLAAARDAEEAKWRQAMVRLLEEHQRQTEFALRPAVARAWRSVILASAGLALLVLGFLLLLNHEYGRLKDAQARADTAEVSAEVQRAARHVEISACGGRPCIRLDRDTPTWKSRGHEYVLVDGGEN